MARGAGITRRLASVWFASLSLLACGSNTPKIPPELLATGGCDSSNYPNGPFGTQEGDILADACFQGFRNPATVSHSASALETIAFADYYDPTGS